MSSIFSSVYVGGGGRVGVGARTRACASARVALIIRHATHGRHIFCGFSDFIIFFGIVS
jgi:hypothetical protein